MVEEEKKGIPLEELSEDEKSTITEEDMAKE